MNRPTSLLIPSLSPKKTRRFIFLVSLSRTSIPPLFRSPTKRFAESDQIVRILQFCTSGWSEERSYAVKNGLERFSLYKPSFVPTQSRPSRSLNAVVHCLPSRYFAQRLIV